MDLTSFVPNYGVGGCNSSHSRCVCMDGSGGLGQLATAPLYPPSSHMRSVRVYWREAGLGSNSCLRLQSPPSTSPLSTCCNCVTSSQEHEFSIPFLLRSAIPRSCITFVFPAPAFLKYLECRNMKPGTRTHLCLSLLNLF